MKGDRVLTASWPYMEDGSERGASHGAAQFLDRPLCKCLVGNARAADTGLDRPDLHFLLFVRRHRAASAPQSGSAKFHERVAKSREVGHEFGRRLDLVVIQPFLDRPGA
jgi:hypothetical protein